MTAPPSPTSIADIPGWQPIESAPKEELVLLFEPHDMGGFIFAGCATSDGVWYNNLDLKVQLPTHWMPLPAAPLARERSL